MLEITLSMIIWGSLGMVVMWSKMSAINIAFLRCLIGAIIVGLYLLKTRQKISFDKILILTATAGIFAVLNWILLFKSFQLSSITIGNMSYYLQPVILLTLGFLFKIEKFSWRKILLIIFSLIGLLLTVKLSSLTTSSNMIAGILSATSAAVLYSFVTLIMRKINSDLFVIIFIQLIIGVLITAPFVEISTINFHDTPYALIIGIIHTPIAYYLYYQGIKKVDVSKVAVLSYLDPITAIISDVVFFNQQLDTIQITGIIITFVSGWLLVRLK